MIRDAGRAGRSTCASARRRRRGPATTASTRRRATSSSPRRHTPEEIARFVGADSLGYLSLDGLHDRGGQDRLGDEEPTGSATPASPTSTRSRWSRRRASASCGSSAAEQPLDERAGGRGDQHHLGDRGAGPPPRRRRPRRPGPGRSAPASRAPSSIATSSSCRRSVRAPWSAPAPRSSGTSASPRTSRSGTAPSCEAISPPSPSAAARTSRTAA